MATEVRQELKARSFGQNIESDLASKFLRVVESAAIASARTMGRGERELSDKVATESMRATMVWLSAYRARCFLVPSPKRK